MSDAFIHTCYVEGYWPERDAYFTWTALLTETLAVYYWCESFVNARRGARLAFCVIGQRGLSEYVALTVPKLLTHLTSQADTLHETWGFKFGTAIALREALRRRRNDEVKRPEYMDQCNASTYRAKKQLNANYKVGSVDQPIQYDLDGFARGRQQIWTLTQFKTPIQILDEYARSQYVRTN